MNIKLDDEHIKETVSAAILTSLTQESREILIKDTLKYLLSNQSYGSYRSTPLEQMYQDAAKEIAYGLIKKELEKPAIISRIQALVAESISKALTDENKENLINKLSDTFAEKFFSRF